jgi:hypothetical protein
MDLDFNDNNYEYEYDDSNNEEKENDSLEESVKELPSKALNQNKINIQNNQNEDLSSSSSTLFSSHNLKNSSFNKSNNTFSINSEIQNCGNSILSNSNNDYQEKKISINENDKYQNILNLIIDKKYNKFNNSIIISGNNSCIDSVTNTIINFFISQNKKICILVPDTKRAKNFYEIYNANNIKTILLQKGKSKKNKNDLQSFLEQLNQNTLFIILPNILYKLLSIGFVKLSDFGLIIFDECQLCDSNHPYNIIMQEFYFYYHISPSSTVNTKTLPNIIGLTNSPFKEKVNIKNDKKKVVEILKNISENLDCQIVLDQGEEDKTNLKNENYNIIEVNSIFNQKNKIDGINIILMKYFFEPMLDFCLEHYLKVNGDKKELNQNNKNDIKNKYLNVLKEKFSKETFEEYNNIETSERSIHFLSQNSIMFKTFEDIQKLLINIIQNTNLEEIYYLFEKYKKLYEINLKNQEELNDTFLQKFYKKLVILFNINMKVFKSLLNKKIKYETDRLSKFNSILTEIYTFNKTAKCLIFVINRKMAYILHDYLNRDINFKNKTKYIVGYNNKKEENISLTLSTRKTMNEINEIKKDYNDNKINILICTPPTLEYLTKEECDHILIFSEMVNINNDLEKIKEKAKNSNANLHIFISNTKNKNNLINSINAQNDDDNLQLKKYFLDKNYKDYRAQNFIEKKNLDKMLYYYINKTESKMTLKNCMLLFNEISNSYISKNVKINVEKNFIEYGSENKFACQCEFQLNNQKIKFTSNKYNDKQSAENECYYRYIIFLHKNEYIDDNFRIKL